MPPKKRPSPLATVSVEYLLLADFAEVLNNKVYMMGAGWDTIIVGDFSQPAAMTIAAGILVPWGEANREHSFTITLRDLDGNVLQELAKGRFTTGRAPDQLVGMDTHLPVAGKATVPLSGPGEYLIVVSLDGGAVERSLRFRAKART